MTSAAVSRVPCQDTWPRASSRSGPGFRPSCRSEAPSARRLTQARGVSIVAVLNDQRGRQPCAMPGHLAPSFVSIWALASDPLCRSEAGFRPSCRSEAFRRPIVSICGYCCRPFVSICSAADLRVDLRLSIGDVLNDQRELAHVPFEDIHALACR